jgi:regulator of RNase E activity RraA
LSTGLFGEMLATDALNRGIAGLELAAAVRDVSTLEQLEFPAFALGASPAQSAVRPNSAQTGQTPTLTTSEPVSRALLVARHRARTR